MRKIVEIIKDIKEELRDSEKYYKKALIEETHKETYKYLAVQKLDHADRLHKIAISVIQSYKYPVTEVMIMI